MERVSSKRLPELRLFMAGARLRYSGVAQTICDEIDEALQELQQRRAKEARTCSNCENRGYYACPIKDNRRNELEDGDYCSFWPFEENEDDMG